MGIFARGGVHVPPRIPPGRAASRLRQTGRRILAPSTLGLERGAHTGATRRVFHAPDSPSDSGRRFAVWRRGAHGRTRARQTGAAGRRARGAERSMPHAGAVRRESANGESVGRVVRGGARGARQHGESGA